MTALPMNPKDVPGEWAQAAAQALGDAAYDCDGECGLSERACYDAHPIWWSGLAAGRTRIDGETGHLAQVAIAAVIPLIRAQVADEITAHFTQERAQVADAEPVTLGGVHEQAKLLGRYDRVIATIDRIARGDQ